MTRPRRAPVLLAGAVVCALATLRSGAAHAWIFPEHTHTTHRALEMLSPGARERLAVDWKVIDTTAVSPHSPKKLHLCEKIEIAPSETGSKDDWCVGFAVLPALAGDHSCSPSDLMQTMRTQRWVFPVLELSEESAAKIEAAKDSIPLRLDARRDQHLNLQILDGEYVRRAANNSAHFQVPRAAATTPHGGAFVFVDDATMKSAALAARSRRLELVDYVELVTANGHVSNATASFIHYHAAALELAGEAARRRADNRPYDYYAQWAFFNEAFAVHFIEDAFSAGHFVGTWGDVAERLGTHDYYCQNGIDAQTWTGERYAARGDAFMGDAEEERVAAAVAISLEQLAAALDGSRGAFPEGDPCTASHQLDYDYAICKAPFVPPRVSTFATSESMLAVLSAEPVPSSESPALPRFRTELGVNVGVSLAFDGILSTAITTNDEVRGFGRTRFGLPRIGLGVTDLLTRSEDGNMFVEGNIIAERGSDGSRSGFGFRVHAPFAYVPFDGIPFSLCAFVSQNPWCVRNSRRASTGSAYGINYNRRIGQFASIGVTAFRDFSLLFLNEGGLRGPTRRDLLLPLFTVRTGTDYSGRLATHIGVDIGFQWRQQYGVDEQHYLGGFVSLFTDTPYYIAP